jgi:hypothetical protein
VLLGLAHPYNKLKEAKLINCWAIKEYDISPVATRAQALELLKSSENYLKVSKKIKCL